MARLTKCFDHPQLIRSYIAWQDDQDAIDISSDSKYLQFFEILPMESSLVLYTKHISRTRKIFLKLKLATEEKLDFFDLRIRRLGYNKKQSTGTIVVNQGAFSDLRRLTDRTLINLAKKIPNAVFILHKETAERNFFKGTNIKYLISEPGTEKTLLNVISLFESSPRCIITPDTGLAHLATAYEIPMIWLESWVDNRKVLEPQSMNNIKIYKKHNFTSLKNCNAKLRTENWIHPDTLECNFEIVSCLDLDKNNIEELLRLIP
jgi:hypothetical protein